MSNTISVHLRRIFLTATMYLAVVCPAAAVDTLDVIASDPILESSNWIRVDPSSGVAGQVQDFLVEEGGTLWLATQRGLQYYDGLRWTTWTTADGLPSDDVGGVIMTPDGDLWVTFRDAGVARREGDHWVSYGLADGLQSLRVESVQPTQSGDLWITYRSDELGDHVHAVSRFTGAGWETLDLPAMDQLVWVSNIYEAPDGALWLTTGAGVSRYADQSWTKFGATHGAPAKLTFGPVPGENDDLWFAALNEGVYRFDGDRWHYYGMEQGVDPGRQPVAFWRTSDGRMWLGGNQMLAWFDGDLWHPYEKEDYPGRRYAVGHAVEGEQGFWVFDWFTSTFFRYDPTRAAQRFTHPQGLAGGFEDANGDVWFRTGNKGVTVLTGPLEGKQAVRYHDGQWLAYDGDDGFFDGAVYDLSRTDDGDIWYVGLDGGQTALARLSQDGWRHYTGGLVDPASSEPQVHTHYAHPSVQQTDDGRIWLLGGYDGGAALSRFDGDSWTREILADPDLCEWANQIFRSSDGDLWVSCWNPARPEDKNRGGALLHHDDEGWHTYTTLDGLPSTYITGISESPKGILWVGSLMGLSRLDLTAKEATWQNQTDFGVPNPKPRLFLPTDDGMWWAFMANRYAGVVHFDGTTEHRIKMDEGLVDNDVTQIERFADGAMWFLTRGGLSRYDGERWLSYGVDRGLTSGTVLTMQPTRDGSLWIDDGDGSVINFRLPLGSGLPETDLVTAPDSVEAEGNLVVSWAGLDVGNQTESTLLSYQHRLDGNAWSAPATSREVTLTALKAGEHTLEVRSLDADGNRDATPLRHRFVVAAPWWMDPWVLGGAALFIGLILLQTVRVVRRDVALHTANAELTNANAQLEKANDAIQLADRRKSEFLANMSHELRTPMNAIIGFTRIVLRRAGDGLEKRQRDNLTKVESSAEHLLGLINDLLDLSKIEAGRMEVSAESFDLRSVVEACCDSVGPLVRSGVALRTEIEEGVSTIHSDEGKVRQIVINLLSNALKFTDKGEVVVRVSTRGDELSIAVSDTGIGIHEDEVNAIFEEFHQVGAAEREDRGTGLGLAITKRYAQLLGGSIHADSRLGEGSTFTVRLPAAGGGIGDHIL